ncbi:hypothetical protein B0J15DRAFT_498502 [Fusarium solani]|uniref:Uncharacterized protein n=1 Tax=Fusarium solani TaxID=169388 RepID=A0A9P9H0G5_FUSSL|nr:uncharacterized protein B0J15DRAFT_498502 [Fusarium solani]KAH7248436.1 hypothetical protein B0J15DRAFT_498502 [Fusarium solani]
MIPVVLGVREGYEKFSQGRNSCQFPPDYGVQMGPPPWHHYLVPGVNRDRRSRAEACGDDLLGSGAPLTSLATETEKTSEQFRRDKADEGRYYRFNVSYRLEDVGLEKSKKKREIAAATGRHHAAPPPMTVDIRKYPCSLADQPL